MAWNGKRMWRCAFGVLVSVNAGIGAQITSYPSMLSTDSAATQSGWEVIPVLTVSEWVGDYQPVGIIDGIGAFPTYDVDGNVRPFVRVLMNHELNPGNGYSFTLANGTELTGARVSFVDIHRNTLKIHDAGPAFDTVYDRNGEVVVDAAQINETGNAIDGFARLCSARSVLRGEYGFVDNIFFTGEETSKPFHPHGGSEWAIDVDNREIWAIPAMGRAAWENVTPLESGDDGVVAILGGDDVAGAPLYLYIGEKDALGDGSFLDRNGLAVGTVYVWKADNGDQTPEEFNGSGASRSGSFVEINVQDAAMAGTDGYDDAGYLDGSTLRSMADAMGAFRFSRPEDLHDNPMNGAQAVFASTGRGGLFPSDNWGILYIVDVDLNDLSDIRAELTILHDADELAVPDSGIRSPDNLTWADNGMIYVQEDRSTSPGSLFGGATGIEASIWEIDPDTGNSRRVAEVDRSAVAPADATDRSVGDIGNWETSGIFDVTKLFKTKKSETILIGSVQAHSVRDGSIGDNPQLDEGGQLFFMTDVDRRPRPAVRSKRSR